MTKINLKYIIGSVSLLGLGGITVFKLPEIKKFVFNYKPVYNGPSSPTNAILDKSSVPVLLGSFEKFIPRSKIFKDISDILGDSKNQGVIIYGSPGTGKSLCAQQYASNDGKSCAFIDADSSEKVYRYYVELAKGFGILPTLPQTTLVARVNEKLNRDIFIFDNVEKYDDIADCVVNMPKQAKAIITTRLPHLTPQHERVECEYFDEKEAKEYIETCLPQRNFTPQEISSIITNVSGGSTTETSNVGLKVLPHDLKMAVLLFKESTESTAKLIPSLTTRESINDMLFKLFSDNHNAVQKTAWQILQYSAFLDPDFISIDILKKLELGYDGFYNDLLVDEGLSFMRKNCLMESIDYLASLSLVFQSFGNRIGLKMHREMQQSVKASMARHPAMYISKTTIEENLLSAVDDLFVLKTIDQDLLSSVQVVAKFEHSKKLQVSLNDKLGKYYYTRGGEDAFKKSYAHFKTVLDITKSNTSLFKNQKLADALSNFATVCKELNKSDDAIKYFEEALELTKTLGNTEQRAAYLNNIGLTYVDLDKPNLKDGIDNLERSLVMKRKVFGMVDHLDIACSLNNLGEAYKKQYSITNNKQDLSNALDYYKQAYLMSQKVNLDKDNENTALFSTNCGLVYCMLEDFENAFRYCENGFKMYQMSQKPNNDAPRMGYFLKNIGCVYAKFGDQNKAIELYKQAYSKQNYTLGRDHKETKEMLLLLTQVAPHFLQSECIKVPSENWNFDENIFKVKQKLQLNTLNVVQKLSEHGKWSYKGWSMPILRDILLEGGVLKYIDEFWLKKELGTLSSNSELMDVAKMLIFEAINLGIMQNNSINKTCAIEFAKTYPQIIDKVKKEHPNYFVDGSILREFAKKGYVTPGEMKQFLGEDYDGKALTEHDSDQYNDYFSSYSKVGIDALLKLRLDNSDVECEIQTFTPNYVFDGRSTTAERLVSNIASVIDITTDFNNVTDIKILVPLNFYAKHWVGLVVDKHNSEINLHYMDPEGVAVPVILLDALIQILQQTYPDLSVTFDEPKLEHQKYNNCGPEVIENFIQYLTGYRVDQESAVAIHSMLLEDALMGESYANV